MAMKIIFSHVFQVQSFHTDTICNFLEFNDFIIITFFCKPLFQLGWLTPSTFCDLNQHQNCSSTLHLNPFPPFSFYRNHTRRSRSAYLLIYAGCGRFISGNHIGPCRFSYCSLLGAIEIRLWKEKSNTPLYEERRFSLEHRQEKNRGVLEKHHCWFGLLVFVSSVFRFDKWSDSRKSIFGPAKKP